MYRKLQSVISLLIVVNLMASNLILAKAQSGANPKTDAIVVTGILVNMNDTGKTPDDLAIMLHSWDPNEVEKPILHAKSQPGGEFRFEDVPVEPGLTFAAMAVYEEGIYVSEPATLEAGKTNLKLKIPLYESTTDSSQVKVDRVHVLFNFAQDGIEVKELFLLSNLGQLTVRNAVAMESGKNAALRFVLPKDAGFVTIEPKEENRFVTLADGFADNQPLVPGQQSRQVMASFLVPYTDQLTFTYQASYPVDRVNLMFSESAGVTLKGNGLTASDPIAKNSGETVSIYIAENLKAGQTLDVTFSGKPKIESANNSENATSSQSKNEITLPVAIVTGTLSLGMIAGGVWWWRRQKEEKEKEEYEVQSTDDLKDLLTEIALLDQSFERGEVAEEVFHSKRATLIDQAKGLVGSEESPKSDTMEARQN